MYRIHQSGDLANLDGLDDSSRQLLPSLLTLRDALYSAKFRQYVSDITRAGPLSGRKTDMAINVYTPGCHLLCHDDVIGSRSVSYILYLTDPDRPWKTEWGGALRLYPTDLRTTDGGEEVKVPRPDPGASIPPAFNQFTFFAVQPGQSFHDVQEVYSSGDVDEDSQRVRMAISGWYHIPQAEEDGYEEGLEEKLAKKSSSSLLQLQSHAGEFDRPRSNVQPYEEFTQYHRKVQAEMEHRAIVDEDEETLNAEDIDFLLQFLNPKYLTPDALYTVYEEFADVSSLTCSDFLSPTFGDELRRYILFQESDPSTRLPSTVEEIEAETPWRVALPPHKHRYLYQQPVESSERNGTAKSKGKGKANANPSREQDPVSSLLNVLLPSLPFRKWLRIATAQKLLTHDVMARRFRKGKDYTLATGYDAEVPRLEVVLSITPPAPTNPVGRSIQDLPNSHEDEEQTTTTAAANNNETPESKGKATAKQPSPSPETDQHPNDNDEDEDKKEEEENNKVGGYVAYMASDPASITTADPAIYQSSSSAKIPGQGEDDVDDDDDDDGGILFSVPHPCWNTLSLVLRDRNVMRFVKYLGQESRMDRWDLVGEFTCEDEMAGLGDDGEEEDVEDEGVEEGGEDNGGVVEVGREDEEETTEVEGEEEMEEEEASE